MHLYVAFLEAYLAHALLESKVVPSRRSSDYYYYSSFSGFRCEVTTPPKMHEKQKHSVSSKNVSESLFVIGYNNSIQNDATHPSSFLLVEKMTILL